MIILSAKNLSKSYGADVILDNISFHVNKGDKIGIVGLNGAGKSTLLKLITGEIEKTNGEVFIPRECKVGYLRQSDDFNSKNTLLMEAERIFEPLKKMEEKMLLLSAKIAETDYEKDNAKAERLIAEYDALAGAFESSGGYMYKSEMKGILSSMRFTEKDYGKTIDMLSGGERMRFALACLLLKKPDLLLLDEPTNHLDIDTIRWLEQYLKSYSGTIMIVSHDRYFLDKLTNRIFDVENRGLAVYVGNYSAFAERKKEVLASELKKYENEQKEIKRQEEMIRRFKQRGTEKLAKRAQSREKRLEKLKGSSSALKATPNAQMRLRFTQEYKSGNDVLFLENLSKSFGFADDKKRLFAGVDMDIKRGEKVCLLGHNGIGKSTLLKIIIGKLTATDGYIKLGQNVKIGYYDQKQQLLNEKNTVLEEIHDAYRLYSEPEIRGMLGRFMFKDDMVNLPVEMLSGGEKARLSLLKLMMSGANFLVMDEPANHLDIPSKEIFEDAILEFPGTVLVVTHDRYFLSRVPDRILELTANGLISYLGKYDYYIKKKDEAYAINVRGGEQTNCFKKDVIKDVTETLKKLPDTKLTPAEERRLKKELEAKKRREEREKQALEKEIEELEIACYDLENEINTTSGDDYKKLTELSDELIILKDRVQKKYEKWLQYD